MWILIITMILNSHTTIEHIDGMDKEACEVAGSDYKKLMRETMTETYSITTICVRKEM